MGNELAGKQNAIGSESKPQTEMVVGKTTLAQNTGGQTKATTEGDTLDDDEKIKKLVTELQRVFGSNPKRAKMIATQLAADYPDRFTAGWAVKIYKQIDSAADRKRLGEQAQRNWDTRPGEAIGALRTLMGKFPRDAKLRRWCTSFIARIEMFQLGLRVAAWDRRPGDADAAARELHRRRPTQYTQKWLDAFTKRVWDFQDAAWAERVGDDELRAWVGANSIEWGEAPDEVKQELQILLGRKKRDQAFGAGGKGALDKRQILPRTEEERYDVLDKSDDVANNGWKFSTQEELPIKKVELQAKQLEQMSKDLQLDLIPVDETEKWSLFRQRPDVFAQIYNRVIVERAEDLQKASASYKNLAQRLRDKTTTIEAERKLLADDIKYIDNALFYQYDQLQQQEKANDLAGAAKTRQQIDLLEKNRDGIGQVLAQPDGVIPNAGVFTRVLPKPVEKAWTAPSKENADVKWMTDWIDYLTVGNDPYKQSVGRNLNEQLVGLLRFSGRISAFEAGVWRMVADLGSTILPPSLVAPMYGMAEQLSREAQALKLAQSSVTAENSIGRDTYTAAGGKLPLLDRVFSNEKIFEQPDVAILTLLQTMPTTKGASLALGLGITGLQTLESVFSTYGQTGSVDASLKAAGWTALQGGVGVALDAIGVPAGASVVANLAMTFGLGKLRGLSNEQIEEEMVFTLIGAGLAAGVGGLKGKKITNLMEKTHEVVTRLDDGKVLPKSTETESRTITTEQSAKVDRVAQELSVVIEQSRVLTQQLYAAQKANKSTKEIFAQLEKNIATTNQLRTQLAKTLETPKPESSKEASKFRELFERDVDASRDGLSPQMKWEAMQKRAVELKSQHPEFAAMTMDEIIALAGMHTGDLVNVNQGLGAKTGKGAQKEAATYAELVDGGLAKLPSEAGTFRQRRDFTALELDQLRPGAQVRDPALVPLSDGPLQGRGTVEVEVQAKNAKRIAAFGKTKNDNPYMLESNTLFEVVSVSADKRKVVLREIESATTWVETLDKPSRTMVDDKVNPPEKLAWDGGGMDRSKIDMIREHLGGLMRNGLKPHQDKALTRLERIAGGELAGTEYDRRFFFHEYLELSNRKMLEAKGETNAQQIAHYMTIRQMGGIGDNPYELVHPDCGQYEEQQQPDASPMVTKKYVPGMGSEYEMGFDKDRSVIDKGSREMRDEFPKP